MSKRHARRLAVAPAAAVAALAMTASAAAAATWTVRPGGTISLTGSRFNVTDTATATTIPCLSSSLGGTLKSGRGHSGTGIGSITTASIRHCGGLLGMFILTPGDLPWHLNLTSYSAAAHTVTGSISHLHVDLSAGGCSVAVDGTGATASDGFVTFTYTNPTAKLKTLTTGGNLHIYIVRGCAGLFRNHDPATLSATFAVSQKQSITSP